MSPLQIGLIIGLGLLALGVALGAIGFITALVNSRKGSTKKD